MISAERKRPLRRSQRARIMSWSGGRLPTPASRARRLCGSSTHCRRSSPDEAVGSRAVEEDSLTGELAFVAAEVRPYSAQDMIAAGGVVEIDADAPRLNRCG